MKKITIGIILFLIGIIIVIVLAFKDRTPISINSQHRYEIVQKWELPKVLDEVSDIVWLKDDLIAAVQDENGIIFIFNLTTSEIENQIEFSGGGDYEGLAISGKNMYVLRSDGVIFEVLDFRSENLNIQEHSSTLATRKGIDVEGLALDEKNKRLLLVIKEQQKPKDRKEVYAMSLNTKQTSKKPVYKLPLNDPIFDRLDSNGKAHFIPSEMEIHPVTGMYYFLDGTNPKLLIASKNRGLKELYLLDKKNFEKPEGISFRADGTLYISNEAGDNSANILQVSLKKERK